VENGYRNGVVLDRIALISEMVAALPDSDFTESEEYISKTVLTDARGKILYQWGLYTPAEDEHPAAVTALSQPLAAWRLKLFLDTGTGLSLMDRFGALLPGVSAAVAAIVLLSVYYYRENRKVVRDALRKVSFVNQVSHELRTPLTNIRLYGELLRERLADRSADSGDIEQIDVVLSESRRLSRMITNVLTFSRSEKKGFEMNPGMTGVDEVIQRVVDSFALSLENSGIKVLLSRGAPEPIFTDGDFVEQILSNLVGNVEKYAATGGYLEIKSSQDGGATTVLVKDRGPGIPPRERNRVFEPFYRVSNRLTDGVSGAGIGLAVSKLLAKKIGGALTLEKSDSGALFKLELPNDASGESK
jgi:signal transduction histidine kinase